MIDEEIKILLVEDNIHDAEMMIRTLNKSDFEGKLLHLENGEEALDFLFAKNKFSGRQIDNLPQVILLDIKMPKVDGIEVLRQIKSREVTRKIPVVIMTSSNEAQDIITSYDLGANSYVVKPVDFENFVNTVRAVAMYWVFNNQAVL